MKTTNRIPKAIAVVVIVGLGLIHNIEDKQFILNRIDGIMTQVDESQIESEAINQSRKTVFDYSKSIIKSGVKQIISNL